MNLKVTFLSCVCLPFLLNTLKAQNEFEYRALDRALIELWLNQDLSVRKNLDLFEQVQKQWFIVRKELSNHDIRHFDHGGFIEDQELRLRGIKYSIDNQRWEDVGNEALIMIKEFRDIRYCFTTDEYILDQILDAYEAYEVVSDIVHDQMMGLYEWSEFIWFVDQLKCKVDLVDQTFETSKTEYTNASGISEALDKIEFCLKQLDESVATAYQPNFTMPCDDTGEALLELLRQFAIQSKYRI